MSSKIFSASGFETWSLLLFGVSAVLVLLHDFPTQCVEAAKSQRPVKTDKGARVMAKNVQEE